MELKEIISTLADALAEARIAKKEAAEAKALAQEIKIELEAQKRSTHKIEYVNPWDEVKKLVAEEKEEEQEEKPKVSPFTLTRKPAEEPLDDDPFELGA